MADEINLRTAREVIAAGPGAQATVVSLHAGMVVIHFQRPCEWASFDPETARQVAEKMARYAYEAAHGRPPSDDENLSFLAKGIRKKLSKVLREKMVNRTILLLRNFLEKKPPLGYQAEQIVDHVLKEIL